MTVSGITTFKPVLRQLSSSRLQDFKTLPAEKIGCAPHLGSVKPVVMLMRPIPDSRGSRRAARGSTHGLAQGELRREITTTARMGGDAQRPPDYRLTHIDFAPIATTRAR